MVQPVASPSSPSVRLTAFELPTITHLVHLHHDALYRYAFRLTGSAPDAEDLLQQTFLSAHRNLEQLRNVSHAKAWLYTILRNAYLKQLRHRDRYHVELAEELDVPQQEPQQSWFDEERLQSAVRCLPEANRVVVMMFYFEELSYRSIGPAIGSEVSRAALLAIALASVFIILYVAWAFRQVSHPFRFGACAVSALVHDVFVVISFVAIMYFVAGWEINALFLTAVLTVIGYSVNDTIVVFDRIRENSKRHRSESLTTISNRSILETAQRSIATVVTTLLPLIAILILGGPTLRQFMATLIIGLISGGYSSIFNATALLVSWEERSFFPRKQQTNGMSDSSAAMA